MNFNNRKSLIRYLNQQTKQLGFGSQGAAYYDFLNKKVIKIYHEFFYDEPVDDCPWTEEDILKFGRLYNDTYIFPDDIVVSGKSIYGYTSRFVSGQTLDHIKLEMVNINEFIEAVAKARQDLKEISKKHILCYDTLYNTMYGDKIIHVIDTDEYSYSDKSEEEIAFKNNCNFNMTIMYFLIDSYFEEFINSNEELKDMYKSRICDILEFLRIFKNQVSENIGTELINMSQAKPCLNKVKRKEIFIRNT